MHASQEEMNFLESTMTCDVDGEEMGTGFFGQYIKMELLASFLALLDAVKTIIISKCLPLRCLISRRRLELFHLPAPGVRAELSML